MERYGAGILVHGIDDKELMNKLLGLLFCLAMSVHGAVIQNVFVTNAVNHALAATTPELVNFAPSVATNAAIGILSQYNVLTNGESVNTVLSNALYVYGKIHTSYPIDGVIGSSNANTLYVDTAGDDSSALKGISYRPWRSIETAASNAVAGDTIIVNQGTYQVTNGVFLPLGGAKLIGIGRPVIQSYATNAATVKQFGVVVTDNSVVDNFAISNMWKSVQYQICVGAHELLNWGTTLTNVVLRNLVMDGDSDCFFVRHTNRVDVSLYDCRAYSRWDVYVLAHTSVGATRPLFRMALYNCVGVVYDESIFNPGMGSFTHAVGIDDDGTPPEMHLNVFGGYYASTNNSQGQVARFQNGVAYTAPSEVNIIGANLIGTNWFQVNDLGAAKVRVTGGLQQGRFINGGITGIGDLLIQGDRVQSLSGGLVMVDTPDVTDGFATWTNQWGPDGGLTLGSTNLAGKARILANGFGSDTTHFIRMPTNTPTDTYILTAAGTAGYTTWAAGGTGGAYQTNWLQDINGNGFQLTNLGGMSITGTLSTPNLLVTNGIEASTMTLSNGPLTIIGPGTTTQLIILTNPAASSQIRIYQPDGVGFDTLTAGNFGTFTLSTSNGPALTLTNYAALFKSNVFASAFINYSNPAVGLSALSADALSISNTPSGNQLVLTNGGAQFSAPVTTTTGTTNDPGTLEFPVAGWVRGLFNNGILDYASADTAIGFTNADSANQVVYMFTNAIPPSSTRVWATAFLTNNGYVGSVTTTNRFTFISGPAVVNAYLGLSSGGGDALSVNPELYYSYDGTNWLGDFDCQAQALTAGRTNLYQFVITFPAITTTNSTGFFVERRLKVRSVGGTPTMYFMVGTNIVSGTNNASHISFSGPSSVNSGAILKASGFGTNTTLYGSAVGTNAVYIDATGETLSNALGAVFISSGSIKATNTAATTWFKSPTNSPTDGQVLTASGAAADTKWATPAASSSGKTLPTGTAMANTFFQVDEMNSASSSGVGGLGWSANGSGTGAGANYAINPPATYGNGRFGMCNVNCGATSNGFANFRAGAGSLFFGNSATNGVWMTILTPPALSDNTDNYQLWAGFGTNSSGQIQGNGAYFIYSNNTNGGSWQGCVVSNYTAFYTNTAASVAIHTWYDLAVYGTSNAVYFAVSTDGGGTWTTTGPVPLSVAGCIPNTSAVEFGLVYGIQKSAGVNGQISYMDRAIVWREP